MHVYFILLNNGDRADQDISAPVWDKRNINEPACDLNDSVNKVIVYIVSTRQVTVTLYTI